MCQNHALSLMLVLVVGLSACGRHAIDVAWQEPLPLGRDFPSYVPTQEPKAAETLPIEQPTGILRLHQVLSLALMGNPELVGFAWDVRAAEADTLQAGLRPNPEFELEVEDFAGTGELSGFGGLETTVGLGYLFELGGKRGKRTQVAGLATELAGWDYETKRLDILTKATKAFLGVVAAQQTVSLHEELIDLSARVLTTVQEQAKVGKVSPLEVTKAEVEHASAQLELEHARRALEVTRKQLAATWGSTEVNFERVEGKLGEPRPIPAAQELASRISQNPDIARWSVEMAKRRAAVKLEESARIPDIELGVGFRHLREIGDSAFLVGLSFPLPFFDRNQGGIRAAEAGLAKGSIEQHAAELQVLTAFAEAYQSLAMAYADATSLETKILPAAEKTFEATLEGYREGKFELLELLDAQRTFFETRAQQNQSLAAYHNAVADVERLLGESLW